MKEWGKRSGGYVSVGTLLPTAHYFLKCFSAGVFHWAPVEESLLEQWLVLLLPIVDAFLVIAGNLLNKLQRASE